MLQSLKNNQTLHGGMKFQRVGGIKGEGVSIA